MKSSTPNLLTPRGWGPGICILTAFQVSQMSSQEDSFQSSSSLIHLLTSFWSQRFPVPAKKRSRGKRGEKAYPGSEWPIPVARQLPSSPAPAASLHNGSRSALSRGFHRPRLAPRQREPGGAANMAERRRHKKRIQVAKPNPRVGGFRALGSGRCWESSREGRAKSRTRWGRVPP